MEEFKGDIKIDVKDVPEGCEDTALGTLDKNISCDVAALLSTGHLNTGETVDWDNMKEFSQVEIDERERDNIIREFKRPHSLGRMFLLVIRLYILNLKKKWQRRKNLQ